MTRVLEVTGVCKFYPGSPPVTALVAADLVIRASERVAVLGPSGSGKTTLLHVAGTLERPSSGSVRIGGQEVSELSDAELSAVRGRRLGFVFQQFHLLDHLDAVQNVALGLLYRGGQARARRAAAADGTAVVVITHDPAVAAAMDRRVVMQDGRIIADDRDEGNEGAIPR